MKKVNKGSTALRTFYYYKDIQFLAHEPLLERFRDFKAFMRRVKKAAHKGDPKKAERMVENKPIYTLDHIVRERWGREGGGERERRKEGGREGRRKWSERDMKGTGEMKNRTGE